MDSLHRNGIPVDMPDGTESASVRGYDRYTVQVRQFRLVQAVSMQPARLGVRPMRRRIVQEEDPSLWNKLERIASRAIYAAGWQAGLVKLELRGKTAIVIAGKELHEINKSETDFADQNNQQQVLIGMDPEFVLLRENGRIALASRFLRRRGVAGSDGIRVRDRIVHPVVELRPPPAADPDVLLRRLRGALIQAARQITETDLRWAASGMPAKGLSLGGHIHISGIELTDEVVRALDHYVALPFLMLEDSASLRRRPKYGCLGDVRRQPHGGFEYRTLPSWLVAPLYAFAAIVLCKLAAEHAADLTSCTLRDAHLQAAYYAGDKQALLPVVRGVFDDWRNLPAYAPYSQRLEPFWKEVLEGAVWPWERDLRLAWKLHRYQCQT